MSRNNQFISSDQFHEGFWTTQPNLDSTQINPYSRFQDSIVPDHHHHQGTQFHNPQQNHQLVWLPTNFNTQGNVSLSNYQAHSLSNFQQQQQQREEDEKQNEEEEEEREYLFEKPLTPSDVGKLNRLVIPKQHAEKYFPLGGNDSLLSFEDESGKQWRFRYSYWNSSQSYVLTKGWSRYVKEKQLESGDIVAFERLPGERLFIRWRRRATTTTATAVVQDSELAQVVPNSTAPWTQSFYPAHPYPSHPHHLNNMQIFYQTPYLHAAEPVAQNTTIPEVPVNSRRLRLFGVNFDCQIDEESEPSSSDCLSQSEAQISSYSTSLWSGPQ